MLSGRLLPIHFPPAPDEMLSSWYIRLAHANRLKAETFCTVLWGRQHQIWNRDIDRLSPEWLVRDLAIRTGISFEAAWTTTLKSYEGKIFTELRPTGISPWILPVQMYHRRHKWPGLQFCPECLKEDKEPYFRKRWRLAIYTRCHQHGVLCQDRCPSCQEPIMFHRRELGKTGEMDNRPLSLCYQCDFDLRKSISITAPYYEKKTDHLDEIATSWLEINGDKPFPTDFYIILHHTCSLLVSSRIGRLLRSAIIENLIINTPLLFPERPHSPNRAFFEHHTVTIRHQILHFAFWLLSDPKHLITTTRSSNLKINQLYKDLKHIPDWYRVFISNLPHRDIIKLRSTSSY